MKRSRSPEPELIPLTAKEEEEVLLINERPEVDGSYRSERGLEQGPCTADAQGAQQDDLQEAKAMKHEDRRSRLSRNFSSPSLSPDECMHSLSLSTRGLSGKPKRQRWSPMWLVQLSVLVVALAVVAVLALVFTLRYGEAGSQENRDAIRHSDTGEDGGTNATTRGRGSAAPSRNRHELSGSRTADQPEEAGASSPSKAHGSKKTGAIAFRAARTASPGPIQERVVWWNEGGFAFGRPRYVPFPAHGLASKEVEGRQRGDSAVPIQD